MRQARCTTQMHREEVSRRACLQAGVAGGVGLAGLSRFGAGTRDAMAQDSKPKAGGTLVVRSGPIRGIDPHFEIWGTTLQVVHQAYNRLVKFTPDGTTIVPDLAEAGYPTGFAVELMVGSPGDNVKNAQIVKDQFARVGITVNIRPMEMAQYHNKSYAYDYAMSVHTMLSGEEPEEPLRPYFGANATYYRWGNQESHRLIDAQVKMLDQAKRVEMIHQSQRLILDAAPQMCLYTQMYHVGVQPWVRHYPVPINAYDQRYEAIWVDRERS